MSFEEFVVMTDLMTGKDIESSIGGDTYRGPIVSIKIDKVHCIFELAWHARFNKVGEDDWVEVKRKGKSGHLVSLTLKRGDITVQDLGDGMIRLLQKDGNYHVIFTKHQNLNSKAVKGLNL